jgi:glutaminase
VAVHPGRPLALRRARAAARCQEIYESEAATNQRNQGIAKLLEGYGRMYCDALEATDVYTKQCSLLPSPRTIWR